MFCTEVFLVKRYRLGQFIKKINVAVQTSRIWNHASKLKPDYVTLSRHRYYSQKQLDYVGGYLIKELREG